MPKIINIRKNTLRTLYIIRRLSSYQTAACLGCSPSLVRKKLKEYKILSRTIQEAKALTEPWHQRKNFSGDLGEKAYLIGFRLGDLYVSKTHPNSPTIRISTNTTRPAQITLVRRLFAPYGYVRVYPKDKEGASSVRCYVNNSFSFLLPKHDKVDRWILKRRQTFFAFTAGYADAEGTFCICGSDGIFSVKSQDKKIVHTLWEYFNRHGILCKRPFLGRRGGTTDKRGVKNNKDIWQLTIYRKDALLSFIKEMRPFLKHQQKAKEMIFVKKNIDNRNKKFGYRKDHRWYKTYIA